MPPLKRKSRNGKDESPKKRASEAAAEATSSTGQAAQPQASEHRDGESSGCRPHYRPCRTKEISREFFSEFFSPRCSPKLNLHFDNRSVLLWSRALSHYKSSLLKSVVEMVLNCYSDKTIVRVTFRKPYCQDKEVRIYAFECDVDSVMSPVPGGEDPLEWSELIPLMPEKDKKDHEVMIKSILDKTLFERTVAWVETQTPDGTGPSAVEEVHSLSWPEYSKLTQQVILNEVMSAESKSEILLKLLQAGDTAYQTRAVMNIQEAFEEGMKDSAGRDGVRTLLEHICNIVDCDKLRVKSHGSSNDEYGVHLHIIPCGKPILTTGKGRGEGDESSDIDDTNQTDESSDVDDTNQTSPFKSPMQSTSTPKTSRRNSKSSGSTTSRVSSRKSFFDKGPHDSTDHADMTVFFRKGSQAIPVLVVEIKSYNTEDVFQMQKHLLGGLQFSDEIFGLNINPLSAKIYRMKKDNSAKKICYTHKVYGFRSSLDSSLKIVWKSDSFLLMCDHLCKVLKYSLDKNEQTVQ